MQQDGALIGVVAFCSTFFDFPAPMHRTIAPRMKRLTSVTSQFEDWPHHQPVFLESMDLSH
jgi:hypothetical protein